MLHDISVAVRLGTPEWPGDTPYTCGWTRQLAHGDSVNVSTITMSPHVGTHADAPLHVDNGWAASDELPLDAFMGPALVCTVSAPGELLSLHDLPSLAASGVTRLLLRTSQSIASGVFPDAWPALSPDAVRELVARGLRLLGVDAPSVDLRDSRTLDTHRALFAGGAWNLENLDLRTVPDGEYELTALPLRLSGLDAAPVRALLRPGPAHRPAHRPAMYDHILVSISKPRDAQPAVQTALGLATHSEATIELVGLGQHTRGAVADFAHEVTTETPFHVAVSFPEPPYALALEQLIRSHGIDLVVISAREASARQGPMSGRMQAVIGAASVPVLFIPGPGRPWRELPRPVFRRVVITLDGSPLAESVIPHVLKLAEPASLEITLLTVAPLAQDRDESYLDRMAGKLRTRGAHVHTHVAHDEHAAGGIVLYAYMNNMDLIAMSTHGRGGLSRILLGSVAERVMRLTALPVLLWRPGGAEALAGASNHASA